MNKQTIIPARFTYFNNLQGSSSQLFKRIFRLVLGVKQVEMPAPQAELHRQNLLLSDTLADDLVSEAFSSLPPGRARKLFDQASLHGVASIDEPLPAVFVDFFKHVETEPAWLDWDKLNLGVATCQRLGKLSTYSLSIGALLGGYTNPDLAKPLIFANGLVGDSTFNRITFTSAFWMAITDKDALKQGGKGYKTALFVRLKHALVRRHILKNPEWETDQWGIPINSSDSAITNIGFSTVMMLGARTLGMRISDEEADAVIHFWRYVGFLIGDNDDLVPGNMEEAVQGLFFAAIGNNQTPDLDTLQLRASFLENCK